MRQERPTCRDVCGGAISFLSHGKRTWQSAGEVRIMHHLLTPISFEPSEPCALCLKANIVTAFKRRQRPSIGNIARMVLDTPIHSPLAKLPLTSCVQKPGVVH